MNQEVVRLIEAGVQPREIVAITNVSSATVSYTRKRLGLPQYKSGRKLGEREGPRDLERLAKMRNLRASGCTLVEIGKQVGLTKQRVDHLLNPQKFIARSTINYALRSGRITRPKFCQNCSDPCAPQAHHDDYSKPLAVRWLCGSCHNATRIGERSRPITEMEAA